jgi:hypothetical protein
MTIGTAIVIVMLLYLLDKHGLLKRGALITAVLAVVGLAWVVVQPRVQEWARARYVRHHANMKASLIGKYHDAIPRPPAGYVLESRSVPLEELDKNSAVVFLDDLCKEPQWGELSAWERSAVVEAVMPKSDIFDRVQFEDQCR